jgi:hypothetical protein
MAEGKLDFWQKLGEKEDNLALLNGGMNSPNFGLQSTHKFLRLTFEVEKPSKSPPKWAGLIHSPPTR